jgi:hypothetical protein
MHVSEIACVQIKNQTTHERREKVREARPMAQVSLRQGCCELL